MEIPHSSGGCLLQIPNWGPGGYRLNDNFTHVQNLKAVDDKGNGLKIEAKIETLEKSYEERGVSKVALNKVCTWIVAPADRTVVQYDVPSRLSDGSMHWGGPSTYLYEVSRLRERCVLDIKVPKDWPIFTGLNETASGSHEYTAKTYDILADNPVSTGDLTVDSYLSRGKTHWIVMRGAPRTKVDRAKLLKACKFVSDMETDFFGDSAPYDHYVWHFAVNDNLDGAGGLEHLASTEITLARGVGPRVVDVLAHEFFHLWNVKRIRSKVLGPFDYTKLPETGAIWWLEGVTDYYAYTLLHRYGWTDDTSYFDTIGSNLTIIRRNPAHKEVGPNESSMRVGEDSSGRGNSNGYLISYYNLGWLAGMCLDIEMRSQTGGKHTLDDVEHALWNMCRDDKPGFEEDEIRNQIVKLGGRPMGLAYDRVVMWPDGMRIEQTLAKAGLHLVEKPESYVELGFTYGGGFGASTLRVTAVSGPAAGKLEVGDTIVGVNGSELGDETGRPMMMAVAMELRGAVAGKAIKLTISRAGKTSKVEVVPAAASRPAYSVQRVDYPTPEQKRLGDAWLAKKAFKP
jgi:predicted metalloprotease with PDZ domain